MELLRVLKSGGRAGTTAVWLGSLSRLRHTLGLLLCCTLAVAGFWTWCVDVDDDEDVPFLAAAIACWSRRSHDFCLTGPLDGGELVGFCGWGVAEAGVDVGIGDDGTGVRGTAGEAGVGGGVAATLVVEEEEEEEEVVETDPAL